MQFVLGYTEEEGVADSTHHPSLLRPTFIVGRAHADVGA